jgi:Mg-chelatase subunit ChlD
VLSWLDTSAEAAAIYTFDTHLDERTPFTTGLKTLPTVLSEVKPFGATSLHDAIALTARRVGGREGRRRAVVVLTDGNDCPKDSSRIRRDGCRPTVWRMARTAWTSVVNRSSVVSPP